LGHAPRVTRRVPDLTAPGSYRPAPPPGDPRPCQSSAACCSDAEPPRALPLLLTMQGLCCCYWSLKGAFVRRWVASPSG